MSRKYTLHDDSGILELTVNAKHDDDCIFCDHCIDIYWSFTYGPYCVVCEMPEHQGREQHHGCKDFKEELHMARIIMIIMTAFVLVVSIPSYLLICIWVDILDGYLKDRKRREKQNEQGRSEKGSGTSNPDRNQGGEG